MKSTEPARYAFSIAIQRKMLGSRTG